MNTYHRTISCSQHGVLFAWSHTEWSQAEKDQRKRDYQAAVAPEEELYSQAVIKYRKDFLRRWFNPKAARGDLARATYTLQLLKNEYAPLKDDPPQIADWNNIFPVLQPHSFRIGCKLVFTETLDSK